MNLFAPYDMDEVARASGKLAVKLASDATLDYSLSGTLYVTSGGWLMLRVPNALGRGAFDAINEIGVELPTSPNGLYNAHISVASPDELKSKGIDPAKIDERGHTFKYTLGPVKTVVPKTWDGISKVWYITVNSPDLRKLRNSYGLPAQPNEDWDFHITFGIRRKNTLNHRNTIDVVSPQVKLAQVLKMAAAPKCPHCGSDEVVVTNYSDGEHLCYACEKKFTEDVDD